MATFTSSPELIGYHTMNETNPLVSGNFLYQGGIFFLDGSSNILAYYSFSYNINNQIVISSYSRSNVTNGANYNFNPGAYFSMLYPGVNFSDGYFAYSINTYNPNTGALNCTGTTPGFDNSSRNITYYTINTVASNQVRRRVDPDATGYVVFDQFPLITPFASGTINFVSLRDQAGTYAVNMTVGDIGSGADVEIADRTLTTAQPWQLTGSLRVRLPTSYTYSV